VEVADRVGALTPTGPPSQTAHWTRAAIAMAVGIRASLVRYHRHSLQPHRTRQFKVSNGPQFTIRARDIVWPYVVPPAHAMVLSVDERSQVQTLDRNRPGLPLKKRTVRYHVPWLQEERRHHTVCGRRMCSMAA